MRERTEEEKLQWQVEQLRVKVEHHRHEMLKAEGELARALKKRDRFTSDEDDEENYCDYCDELMEEFKGVFSWGYKCAGCGHSYTLP